MANTVRINFLNRLTVNGSSFSCASILHDRERFSHELTLVFANGDPLLFAFGFEWKHGLDAQFLYGDGLRRANRRDEGKIRKTLAAFYKGDRQHRTMSPWNRA